MITTNHRPSIHILKANPQAPIRLFCFPYAGGGASIYRSWLQLLPPEIEVYAVQLPGREERTSEAPFTHLAPLIEELSRAILPCLHKPSVFFGHSMGALVSFELFRSLRRQRAFLPLHLFVSAHRAPQLPDPYPPIYQLPDVDFRLALRKLNGTPREVLENEEFMQIVTPVLRADFAVCETYSYTPEEPLHCPITAFGGSSDPEASMAELEAWRQQTSKEFQLHMCEGDHFFFYSARDRILRVLQQEIGTLVQHLKQSPPSAG